MNCRTPSSLKWLIVKRSRIAGSIAKAESRKRALLAYVAETEGRCETLRRDLGAIDHSIGLHELAIDPTLIPPTGTRQHFFARGALTRLIMQYLTESSPRWVSTTELSAVIERAVGRPLHQRPEARNLNRMIRIRLAALLQRGQVIKRSQVVVSESGKPLQHFEWRIGSTTAGDGDPAEV